MVGHLDDQLAGRASELHVHVDELHHLAEGATPQVAQCFGEAPAQSKACEPSTLDGRREGSSACRRTRSSATSTTPGTRRSGSASTTGTRRSPTAATTAARLQGLQRLGPGLDGDQGVIGRLASDERGAMEAADALAPAPKRSVGRRLADLFHGRPRLQVGALLAGPVGWLVDRLPRARSRVLLVAAFWSVDALSGEISKSFTLDNFKTLVDEPVYRTIALRTIVIAALVTLTDALLAFPIAFYMAKVASPRTKARARRRGADAALVVLPGQGLRLADDPLDGRRPQLGARPARAHGPGYGNVAVWLVDELPLAAVHDPPDLRRAGADPELADLAPPRTSARRPCTTFRRVILPLAFPAVSPARSSPSR